MAKERPRSAWVIEWIWFREDRKVKTKLLHVLNPLVKDRTVIKYMKCLYMNSEITTGIDRLGVLSGKYWEGMVICEGPRISVGSDPRLTAWHVKDLTIEIDYKRRLEVFRWTRVPGRRYNEQRHDFEDLGQPMKREESLPYA